MEINFKFLPAFLGALALTLALDARAKRPAPVRAPAIPAVSAATSAEPRADTPFRTRDGVRPVKVRLVSLAANRVAGPQAPARPAPADPDDW